MKKNFYNEKTIKDIFKSYLDKNNLKDMPSQIAINEHESNEAIDKNLKINDFVVFIIRDDLWEAILFRK